MVRSPPRSRVRSFRLSALGLAAALFSLAGAVGAVGAQTPAYHAEFLGNPKHVAAMNESGLVVGTGALGIYPRAYFAGPGKPVTYLPIPFGFLSSGAIDINEAGVIVGVISPNTTTAFYPQPARWDPNGAGGYTVTLLLALPGDNRGTADAINNLGDIVGTSNYQGNLHTVLYAPSGTVNLPGLSSLPARSINDQRIYVGGNSRVNLNTLSILNLGVPAGANGAQGWVINASGQIAGDLSLSGPGCSAQAGLYTDGLGWQTVGPCGTSNTSYDLNDQGDVLFTVDAVPYVRFAGGGTHRVEDMIVATTGHWAVNSPFNMAMNNARQIAVWAANGGQSGIILITPDSNVTCQADLGFGGPGALHLSMCGGDLSTGTTADLLLTGAAPGGTVWMIAGLTQNPTPFKDGTLVPVPLNLVVSLPASGAGQVSVPGIPGGHGPVSLYLQAITQDGSQSQGWAISNALRADFLP